MSNLTSKTQLSELTPWAAFGYGRKRRAHIWRESESNSLFARSKDCDYVGSDDHE